MDEMYTTMPDGRIQSRLSLEQKAMLHRFMIQNPSLNEGKFTQDFTHHMAQRLWSKIAVKLNGIQGAQKTWIQWRRTWQDIKINSKKSKCSTIADYHEIPERPALDEMDMSDDLQDNVGTEETHLKRRRAKNMSKAQKKLLYNLVNSNDKLKNTNLEGSTVSCLAKRKEWKKIAYKLNSVTGPQKTWSQWKKCWHDIQKYYVRDDIIEKTLNSSGDDVNVNINDVLESTETRDYTPSKQKDNNMPSNTQINYMIKAIVEREEGANTNLWISLSNKLNALGPCVKIQHEWKNVWTDYKSKVKKLVNRNGTKNLNPLERLTYEYIKKEHNSNVHRTSDSFLTENQLKFLQRTAGEECNIIGNLVAVKLRSMQKEQKLIAEKLISEILFQGQMEMFQYSDKAVNISGYT